MAGVVDEHRKRVEALRNKFASVESVLDGVEREIAGLSNGHSNGNGKARRGPRGRGRGGRRPAGQDLASVIHAVLSKSRLPMRIPAIGEKVKAAGYVSSSPAFLRIVGLRLADKKRFKRISRGLYEAVK